MNHLPIFGNELPAFCSKPGDTADPNAPIDCRLCLERLARKEAEEKLEHFQAAMVLTGAER